MLQEAFTSKPEFRRNFFKSINSPANFTLWVTYEWQPNHASFKRIPIAKKETKKLSSSLTIYSAKVFASCKKAKQKGRKALKGFCFIFCAWFASTFAVYFLWHKWVILLSFTFYAKLNGVYKETKSFILSEILPFNQEIWMETHSLDTRSVSNGIIKFASLIPSWCFLTYFGIFCSDVLFIFILSYMRLH